MSNKPRILIQLDSDSHASPFDSVVAVDAGVEHLLPYANVELDQVRDLVHGAIFTRGPADLCHTAIFIGGRDVEAGEKMLEQVTSTFFGPMRVSVMLDANGANTTAAAAVLAAARHIPLDGAKATVLAATGAVGRRVARLLAGKGAAVCLTSRSVERAEQVADSIRQSVEGAEVTAATDAQQGLASAQIVISAGAAGVELLSATSRAEANLQVAIDLNAVPPLGIGGIEVMDKGVERDGTICYGAIGVGGTKMKIHKQAIQQLFQSNDQRLDAEEILEIGQSLE